jgi:hypothetical protein
MVTSTFHSRRPLDMEEHIGTHIMETTKGRTER